MKKYILTIKHDNGKFKTCTTASSIERAKKQVMNFEHCPESAIVKIKEIAL